MTNPHIVTQNYRNRWSELPEGEFNLHVNDKVNLINHPAFGSFVIKEDGTKVSIGGSSIYILKKI